MIQPLGGLDSLSGIDLSQFNQLSGGFHFLKGNPFQNDDDVIVDEYYKSVPKSCATSVTSVQCKQYYPTHQFENRSTGSAGVCGRAVVASSVSRMDSPPSNSWPPRILARNRQLSALKQRPRPEAGPNNCPEVGFDEISPKPVSGQRPGSRPSHDTIRTSRTNAPGDRMILANWLLRATEEQHSSTALSQVAEVLF
jgi:hypothetical protein